MDRFPRRQFMGRSPGPPAGAAADGLAQGMAYTAVARSAVVNGECSVTIPAIHLTEPFAAHVASGITITEGETVMVVFDEQKRPWITVGGSSEAVASNTAKIAALESPLEWKDLSFASNWTHYSVEWERGQYSKDVRGTVRIKGLLKTTEAYAFPETKTRIATLPEAYWPKVNMLRYVMQLDSLGHYSEVRLDITTAGVVHITEAPGLWTSGGNNGSVNWMVLGNIEYPH